MRKFIFTSFLIASFLVGMSFNVTATELIVIFLTDGSRLEATEVTFDGDRVNYTTPDGLPGFVSKKLVEKTEGISLGMNKAVVPKAAADLKHHPKRNIPKLKIEVPQRLVSVAEENMRLKRYSKAEENWNEIIRIDSKYDYAFFSLGVIAVYRDKDYPKAISYFDQAIKINPNRSDYYYLQAIYLQLIGDCKAVIDNCNRLLTIKPKYSSGYFLRAECYEKEGELLKAKKDYEKSKKYDPGISNKVNQKLAALSIKTGELIPALPEYVDFFIKRSDIYLADKEFDLAINELKTAIKVDPEKSEAYYKLGRVYSDNFNDHKQAVKYFSKAIQVNAFQVEYAFQRGLAYYSLNSWELAKEDFTTFIASNPKEDRAYYYRGMCNVKLNENNQAVDDLLKAKELDPSWTEGVDRVLANLM